MSKIKHSKNIVTAHIDANGNVIVGDGNNITVINLKEAAQYKHLEAEIEKLNTRFERTQQRIEKYPDDQELTVELIEIDEERSQKIKDLEALKQEVIKLAEDFARIPINTERLKKAKAHFESGEFAEARAVLDAEVMGQELDALLDQKETLSIKTQENQQSLSEKANEYLILARLTATNFEMADRFEKTVEYFEQSLRAERSTENIFAYAYFLAEHNQHAEASKLYEEALQIYRTFAQSKPESYLPDVAQTLNNLAILHTDKGELENAQVKYKEALKIYRSLAQSNPATFLKDVATILNNLANSHRNNNELEEAQVEYEEALDIRRTLAQGNPHIFLSDVAITLDNFAVLRRYKKMFEQAQVEHEEALSIQRTLVQNDAQIFMPDLVRTLNNFAILHIDKNELDLAQIKFEEALSIQRQLAKKKPHSFLKDVAMLAVNLALFYQNYKPDRKKSIELVWEGIKAATPFKGYLKLAKDTISLAEKIIEDWGLDINVNHS